jgi:hypothetical protein
MTSAYGEKRIRHIDETKIGQFGYPAVHFRRMRQSGRLPLSIIPPIWSKESKGG